MPFDHSSAAARESPRERLYCIMMQMSSIQPHESMLIHICVPSGACAMLSTHMRMRIDCILARAVALGGGQKHGEEEAEAELWKL